MLRRKKTEPGKDGAQAEAVADTEQSAAQPGSASPIGGIDLGGTKIAASVLDPSYNVLSRARRPTPDRGGPEDVAQAMAEAMNEAADAAGVSTDSLRGVGVGSPGTVEGATGTVEGAGNLPGWQGRFALGPDLTEKLGTRVVIGNDVSVGTSAEFHLGAGKPYSSVLGVFWGTGVGGGLILNGKEWVGRGGAGEIGHMVVKRGGARCPCGRRGCMEAYAGRKAMEEKARAEHDDGRKTALFKLMKKHEKTHMTSRIWFDALSEGDQLAEELLYRAVRYLAAGIASAINLLDVEAVIVGGGLGIRFGDTLVPKVEQRMGKHLFRDDDPPAFHVAALGDDGGMIGAAMLLDRPPTPMGTEAATAAASLPTAG